jgi:outer membrane protein assembly factor BamD (BamD/ComL family)
MELEWVNAEQFINEIVPNLSDEQDVIMIYYIMKALIRKLGLDRIIDLFGEVIDLSVEEFNWQRFVVSREIVPYQALERYVNSTFQLIEAIEMQHVLYV